MRNEIEKRKYEHLEVCLKKNVEHGSPGFEDVHFIPNQLPEISEIDTSTKFLGHRFETPILIEPMTGGTKLSHKINRALAKAAQEFGIGMGVGSQKAAIENPKLEYTYEVRDVAPDIFLEANLGISELQEYDLSKINKVIEMIDANALSIHLNPLQELIQPKGYRNFKGIKDKFEIVCNSIEIPVIAKSVGIGISKETALKLEKMGVSAIDIGGWGGTNFTKIENLRRKNKLGKSLYAFGIPTVASIVETVNTIDIPIIASGGIRSGIDIAKSIALGANLAGAALPFLRACCHKGINNPSSKNVKKKLSAYNEELGICMKVIGARNLKELRNRKIITLGKMHKWFGQFELI